MCLGMQYYRSEISWKASGSRKSTNSAYNFVNNISKPNQSFDNRMWIVKELYKSMF